MSNQDEIVALKARLAKLQSSNKLEFLPGMIAMSLISILGFAIVCLFLVPMPMTEAAGTLAVALVAAVTSNVGMVVGFFFGSSKDSKSKDETIKQQAETTAVTASTAATVAGAAAIMAGAPAPGANGALETAGWNDAVTVDTPAAFEAYLAKFPAGVHAAEARSRLGALRAP